MTKDNWIKAFDEITVTYTDTGNHSWQEPLNLEPEEYNILTNFISKVENDAENRGYTKGLKAKEAQRVVDALGSEQGKELVDNLVQDAIEKTNKRWVGKFNDIKTDGVTRLECGCEVIKVTLCDKHAGFIPLSDLLEDKK